MRATSPGQAAYEGYCEYVLHTTGVELAPWDEQENFSKAAWETTAEFVLQNEAGTRDVFSEVADADAEISERAARAQVNS